MIKPNALSNTGHIIQRIQDSGLHISNVRMAKLKKQDAEEFYGEH